MGKAFHKTSDGVDLVAEVIEEQLNPENYGDQPSNSMLGQLMNKMKYERKFSAFLYAFNGTPECLKLKLEYPQTSIGMDGELLIWNSLHLPTLGFVN
ncbi:hypothetical protein VNO78_14546 [Psophocarpus tetragonolobus]|uniref:Uncharacterized protein n=1 Tax=Psophocarpus tetragonolobus TaxID=3891 RepID=A0AAN9SYV2_PSOTE